MNAFDLLMRGSGGITTNSNTNTKYKMINHKDPSVSADNYYLLQFDGLSEPNPGRSSAGAVVFWKGNALMEAGHYIEHATNNEAEYGGLILGLEKATELGIKNLYIEGDSMLVIKQMLGEWKVKEPRLINLHTLAKDLVAKFDNIGATHVRREYNKYADALTNECIKASRSFYRQLTTPKN
jgi:ribonuclease HI